MAKSERQKQKLLALAQLLETETDEEHGLTVAELIAALGARGIRAERKSIYDDLETLRDAGYDVVARREGRACRYALASRTFEVAELKLLVDAVQSCKFLTEKKSRALIKKLEGLCSRHEAHGLQRQVYVANRVKTMNESVYYAIDTIHTAISEDRRIRFFYVEWTMDKTVRYRHGGKRYEVSPYALLWDDENYYLLAWDGGAKALRHYRVDKMEQLAVAEQAREGRTAFEAVDLASYSKRTFGMFGGEPQALTLRFSQNLAGVVLDRFGKDVALVPHPDSGTFTVHISAVVSPQFMGWLAGFGGEAKVEAPAEVAAQFTAWCRGILAQYETP